MQPRWLQRKASRKFPATLQSNSTARCIRQTGLGEIADIGYYNENASDDGKYGKVVVLGIFELGGSSIALQVGWLAVIRRIWHRPYRRGDWVVFRKVKRSTAPGPRARHIAPTPHGEEYVYEVKKYYIVEDVQDGCVIVRTRKGRVYRIDEKDPRLRHAHWWERWWLRSRFPHPGLAPSKQETADF